MSDLVISVIRTVVPTVAGTLLAALAGADGEVDEATLASVSGGAVALFTAVYYAIVRFIEQKYPQAGWLLGYKSKPKY